MTTIGPYAANKVKPHVTLAGNAYPPRVGRRKTVYWEKSKSKAQTIFVRRLQELMEVRKLSDNELARMVEPRSPESVQRSISRITGCTQDPTLEKVNQIAEALAIPVAALFSDEPVRQRTPLVKGTLTTREPVKSLNTAKRNAVNKGSR
jgi:hypothetical protein